jgi:hypothetical protein
LNRAEYFVPVTVKIPGRELVLAKRFGAEHTVIDFVSEIKDEVGGTTVTNVRDNVDVKLSGSSAADLAKQPIVYSTGFTLLPGRYTIKFLARDDETGRIGTYQTTFAIPNLNKETKRVPISSVVLSSQRVEGKEALFNTAKGKELAKNDAVNPLVNADGKLIPSVTRVFHAGRELQVFLQAYSGAPTAPSTPATAPAPRPTLLAFVTLYRDGKKALQTQPVQVAATPDSRLGTTPIALHVPLDHQEPGEYQCQVTVLDPSTDRATFWQGAVAITP